MPGLSSGRTWALPARLLFILAALLALPALTACRPAPPLVQQEAFVFGTRVEVIVAGQPEAEARAATGAVLREFDRLHRSYHAWQPSELSTLNAALAAGKSAEVSEELAAWLREAGLELEDVSGLAYEPWRNSARIVSRTGVNYLACAVKP